MTSSALERKYDEPPLVEAVFELFTAPSSQSFSADRFFAEFAEYVSPPQPWTNTFVINVDMAEGRPVSSQLVAEDAAAGERRWNEGRTRGVLVGPGVIAFNVLPPYGHFSDHRPRLKLLLEKFRDAVKPGTAKWIGHRYINRISALSDASEVLSIYPRFPESVSSGHPPFSMQMEIGRFDGGVVWANLALEEARKSTPGATYILDLYARSSDPLKDVDVEWMISWHDRAHIAVGKGFEMIITDTARALFKESK